MNIDFIEDKMNEIIKELEMEVMTVLMDESLDKKQTNLHMKPLTSTKKILNKEKLDKLKPTAILINTARGELIDESHLISLLREKKIFAAGLDVYENEPEINRDFFSLDNVILLPHIGSATRETRNNMAELAARNIVEVLNNRKALTPVSSR